MLSVRPTNMLAATILATTCCPFFALLFSLALLLPDTTVVAGESGKSGVRPGKAGGGENANSPFDPSGSGFSSAKLWSKLLDTEDHYHLHGEIKEVMDKIIKSDGNGTSPFSRGKGAFAQIDQSVIPFSRSKRQTRSDIFKEWQTKLDSLNGVAENSTFRSILRNVQNWLRSSTKILKMNEKSLDQYERVVKAVGFGLDKDSKLVTRRDMFKLVQPFTATTVRAFAVTENSRFLRDRAEGKIHYPEHFMTHIWDGTEYSMNLGMRNLLSLWNADSIDTYKCIYSNSQFHIAAAIVSHRARERLHESGIADRDTGYWSTHVLSEMFEDLAANTEKFSWTASPPDFDVQKWNWNWAEIEHWLLGQFFGRDKRNVELKKPVVGDVKKSLENFGFVDDSGTATIGAAGLDLFKGFLTGTGQKLTLQQIADQSGIAASKAFDMLDILDPNKGWKIEHHTIPPGGQSDGHSEWEIEFGGPGVREDGTLDVPGPAHLPGGSEDGISCIVIIAIVFLGVLVLFGGLAFLVLVCCCGCSLAARGQMTTGTEEEEQDVSSRPGNGAVDV